MLLSSEKLEIGLKAKLFRGFGDPSRLSILDALRSQPLTVTQIIEKTGLTQSNVSNHMTCLKECGLVTSEQTGRYITYRLSDDRVGDLISLAESLLSDMAQGIYACTRYNTLEKND